MTFDINNLDSVLSALTTELTDNGPQTAAQLTKKAVMADVDMDEDQMNELLFLFAEEGAVQVDDDGVWSVAA